MRRNTSRPSIRSLSHTPDSGIIPPETTRSHLLMLNRFRGLTAAQMILLAVLLISAIAFLIFGGIIVFSGGRIARVISRREVLDGLSISAMAAAGALYLFLRPRQTRSTAPRRSRPSPRFAVLLVALILIAAGL